ncbi:tyrosine-type recombinase/integrase [Microbacterium allomyrinae]|uniref:Site-specific integrase n=1 Tax=Microbacterium allomyrinae TaxID=2830666 RepID=A0A9X1LV06_9MICO|nr:site-specific integrase [Microbacterium allomyrinae]MCC2032181.1 site-specific integrase [Microbacterium allomyrinae]
MASIKQRPDGKWRARYRGPDGQEYAKHANLKRDAQTWLDEATAAMQAGTWVNPTTSKMTAGEWLDTWLAGYASNKPRTLRAAEVHAKLIRAKFGSRQLRTIRPSDVKAWTAELQKTYAPSYVYALHRRLSQILSDAVHDGVLVKNPCSRRTSPPAPKQKPYVATTEQVWALHDALKPGYRNVVLLGAFAGLRAGEMSALDIDDVDWESGVITPEVQHDDEDLKSDLSGTSIPIPLELAKMLRQNVGTRKVVPGVFGRGVTAYQLNRVWDEARVKVKGLPPGFRIHDLRHYFASMLIAAGLDVKVVQARMRHASATVTLNTYGHLWPDTDDTSRAAVAAVLGARKSPPSADSEGSSSDSAD